MTQASNALLHQNRLRMLNTIVAISHTGISITIRHIPRYSDGWRLPPYDPAISPSKDMIVKNHSSAFTKIVQPLRDVVLAAKSEEPVIVKQAFALPI